MTKTAVECVRNQGKANKTLDFNWHGVLQDDLAQNWHRFVGCNKRLQTEAPFLVSLLSRFSSPRVLDAAMGIGCEAIWLAKEGHQVVGNELSVDLRLVAATLSNQSGVSFPVTSYDWREMALAFNPGSFDIVLLLGNSLSLLREERNRRAVAQNLEQITSSSGLVVVDERNFRYILGSRKSILSDEFRYSREFLYCGDEICGRPIAIDDDCVKFGYFEDSTGRMVGDLDMHPFGKGEIISLFTASGFSKVEVFSDFRQGAADDADFFTYVFSR